MTTEQLEVISKIDVKDISAYLTKEQKLIIRTEEQDNEFWGKKEGEVIGTKLKEWATNLEDKIGTLTATERTGSENTLAYLERVLGDINTTSNATSAELEALRKSAADGDGAASEIQKQFDTFKKAKEKELSDLTGKVTGMEGEAFNNRVKGAVNEALSKIRPTLKKDKDNDKLIESAIQNEINNFYSSVKAVDHQGGLIFHDQEDKPLIDKTNGNHLGAVDILSDKLSYLIDKDRVVGGTGGADFKPEGGGANKYKLEVPETVKTKVQLTTFLTQEKQLNPNDAEFNKYFLENGAKLPLR